ncbi:DUF4179 domain-containing protein [Paenibacillus sp. Marseille-P2973]|uniref:DUF4179 domain-containing protein n=1 Tax=Paenibacillus sp. Marseille-P2973 TaxID=1871032 RepID=UPI001B393382|nr:DUF4179 domain-containing protein [Paenibacillus sp. Marseille-P2973]MBQ4899809.1 DUF4179 domain-containing protein [Paenibacillus sp. Marseille-P2973]
MNKIEERLAEEKKRIDSITAPEDLEMRLRKALDKAPSRSKRRVPPIWKAAAAVLLFIVILSFNFPAFAYYGKQLLGFDGLINGTLQELNDQGKGQTIEKRMTLEDGTLLTIDGLMTDANQLILFYTLSNPQGVSEADATGIFSPAKITGFLTDSFVESGVSQMNDEHTEIKGTYTFEPVSPFAKKLTLHFRQQPSFGTVKDSEMTFAYDPNKAMQTEVKQRIRKTLEVDKGTITFQTITATPTMTMIKGTLNIDNFDRIRNSLDGIELIANGQPVDQVGSGRQSSYGGMKFDIRYDALPQDLKSLKLVIKEFVGYRKLDLKIPLPSPADQPVLLEDKELWIKKVSSTSRGIEITIATEEDVMLDGVFIQANGENIPLNTTLNQHDTKLPDGTILKERTLLFDASVQPEQLIIKGMHYMKPFNINIKIPVD